MGYIVIDEKFNEMGLSDSEKLVLGLISGFSQNKQGVFYGSRTYIQKWLGCKTTQKVDNVLKSLMEKGLIEKGEVYEGGVRRCTYKVIFDQYENHTGMKNIPDQHENHTDTGMKIMHNNKIDNKEIINIDSPNNAHAKDVEQLQAEFHESLEPFRNIYPDKMLEAFEDWWAAPIQHQSASQRRQGIYLHYQECSTWSLAGRLRTWKRKDDDDRAIRAANMMGRRQPYQPNTNTADAMAAARESLSKAAAMMRQETREQMAIEEQEAQEGGYGY